MLGTTYNKLTTFQFSEGDRALVESYNWILHKYGYIRSKDGFLHNLILPKKPGYVVDHINRDKLDNRRENLRYATISENRHNSKMNANNSSGAKGVRKAANGKHWLVSVMVQRKSFYLGCFLTLDEAVKARVAFLTDKGTT